MDKTELTQNLPDSMTTPRPAKAGIHLKELVGSGDRIMLLTAPFLIIGLILNMLFPAWFNVGGPFMGLKVISIILLIPGVVCWLWSVILVLTKVPQNNLITYGPYAVVRHPLYTSVALFVLPWVGFLMNSWLGGLVGVILYCSSRLFSPEEEKILAKNFGPTWEDYCQKVKIPWL